MADVVCIGILFTTTGGVSNGMDITTRARTCDGTRVDGSGDRLGGGGGGDACEGIGGGDGDACEGIGGSDGDACEGIGGGDGDACEGIGGCDGDACEGIGGGDGGAFTVLVSLLVVALVAHWSF